MKTQWIKQNNNPELILFFNGWGMDEHVISHVEGDFDLLMFYDYRSLEIPELSIPDVYANVYLIGWSMGVWAAANVVGKLKVDVAFAVAVSGSELPVDDKYGIPGNIYRMTENGMDERGRNKFFSRMLPTPEARARFKESMPQRELKEQLEELCRIREQSASKRSRIKWDRVVVSEGDLIFPPANLLQYWEGKAEITVADSGHYPFYTLDNWNKLITR